MQVDPLVFVALNLGARSYMVLVDPEDPLRVDPLVPGVLLGPFEVCWEVQPLR